jgi:hypothetical protein
MSGLYDKGYGLGVSIADVGEETADGVSIMKRGVQICERYMRR